MEWSTCNSNNQKGLLKFNGPYKGSTAQASFTGVRHPHVIEVTRLIKIGEVKVYGATGKENSTEEAEQIDDK